MAGKRMALPALILLNLILLSATARAESLVITDAWLSQPPGVNAAVYFQLSNTGAGPVILTGGCGDLAGRVEIHRHRHHQGMMMMEKVAHLELGPGEMLTFAPGGYHLMLLGLKRQLSVGERLSLCLLDKAGKRYDFHATVTDFTD